MKISAMGSSKYEFEPELFEKDVKNKIAVAALFKENIKEEICKDYKYRDGSKMSNKWKKEILIKVLREYIEEI